MFFLICLSNVKVFLGLPLALSKGHFLDGDPQLFDRIEGLNPDQTEHDSRLVIEPVSNHLE